MAVGTMSRRVVRAQSGFTLLELLIALAITAAVVTLMFAGFALIGRSEDRNQRLMDRSEHMLVVTQWLGRKFDGLRMLGRSDGANAVIFFSGNAAGALWVAPLPERGDSGGLYVFRASPLRHEDGRTDLVIEAMPYDGGAMQLDWGGALRETLLPAVQTLQWYYQDGRTSEWVRNWDSARREFPSRIKLEIGDERGDWPPLVFALARAR